MSGSGDIPSGFLLHLCLYGIRRGRSERLPYAKFVKLNGWIESNILRSLFLFKRGEVSQNVSLKFAVPKILSCQGCRLFASCYARLAREWVAYVKLKVLLNPVSVTCKIIHFEKLFPFCKFTVVDEWSKLIKYRQIRDTMRFLHKENIERLDRVADYACGARLSLKVYDKLVSWKFSFYTFIQDRFGQWRHFGEYACLVISKPFTFRR